MNKEKIPNYELYLGEALLSVDYLLRNTDTENFTNCSKIIRYIKEKLSYEPRRQRIAEILNYLVKNQDKTRRLGFVVGAKQTGLDAKRKKFHISERLLTMQEINAIHLALENFTTPLTGSKRIEEIVKGLKEIFPTDFDKKYNLIDPDYIVPIESKDVDKKLCDDIHRSFIGKNSVMIKVDGTQERLFGRIEQIYYRGKGKYAIKLIDKEYHKEYIINLEDIKKFEPNFAKHIDFNKDRQLSGNLSFNSKPKNTMSFATVSIDNVVRHISKEPRNDNKQYIQFEFTSLDIIESFRKEFDIDLLNLIYHQNNGDEELVEEGQDYDPNIKKMKVSVNVSLPKFVEWAARPENILDIQVIAPFELNNEIRNRLNYVNRLAQTKYNYIAPKQYPQFEIEHKYNNEITITKIHGESTEIVIPDTIMGYPVTEIGRYACCNHLVVRKLLLGRYVKKIDYMAFGYCENLKEIEFNENLEEIGPSAFKSCSSLKEIQIDSVLKYIHEDAFMECSSLESVGIASLDKNYLTIMNRAFFKCINLDNVDISYLKYIGKFVFFDCPKLTLAFFRCSPKVVIPDEYIDNPKTAITVGFNGGVKPEKDPFEHLTSKKHTYFDNIAWDWYEF